jgi:transposase
VGNIAPKLKSIAHYWLCYFKHLKPTGLRADFFLLFFSSFFDNLINKKTIIMTVKNIIAMPGIGIDVGKRELVTCIRRSNGVTETPATFANSSIGFKKFVVHLSNHEIEKTTPILLESTGPYHWPAARFLADCGYAAKIVNPLHTKHMARYSIRKRKTDKIDAAQLAFLASQQYGYTFVETKEMAQKKALIRHYWKLKMTAGSISIHERYLKQYRGIGAGSVTKYILEKCESLKKRIVKEWGLGNDVKYLDGIPGISPFLAVTILAELLPLERFQRIDQIVAFAGLDPSIKQTGGKPGIHGRLSKRGSRILRHALFLAALGSYRWTWKPFYDSYRERGLKHTEALCIISRKILRTAIALLKKRRVFDPKYIDLTAS